MVSQPSALKSFSRRVTVTRVVPMAVDSWWWVSRMGMRMPLGSTWPKSLASMSKNCFRRSATRRLPDRANQASACCMRRVTLRNMPAISTDDPSISAMGRVSISTSVRAVAQ